MITGKFEVGKAYVATPAMVPTNPRKIAVVIGRQGSSVTIAWVEDLQVAVADSPYIGREVMQVKRPEEIYNLSSAVQADCMSAAEIMDIFRKAQAS